MSRNSEAFYHYIALKQAVDNEDVAALKVALADLEQEFLSIDKDRAQARKVLRVVQGHSADWDFGPKINNSVSLGRLEAALEWAAGTRDFMLQEMGNPKAWVLHGLAGTFLKHVQAQTRADYDKVTTENAALRTQYQQAVKENLRLKEQTTDERVQELEAQLEHAQTAREFLKEQAEEAWREQHALSKTLKDVVTREDHNKLHQAKAAETRNYEAANAKVRQLEYKLKAQERELRVSLRDEILSELPDMENMVPRDLYNTQREVNLALLKGEHNFLKGRRSPEALRKLTNKIAEEECLPSNPDFKPGDFAYKGRRNGEMEVSVDDQYEA